MTSTTHNTPHRPTICHVIHALGVGGAEVLVEQMVRRMSDDFRCVVAVLDDVGEIGERLRRDGFLVEHLHRQPGIDRACARRLRAFADREGAALLHAHQCTPCFQAMLSRGLTGHRPVVLTEHGRHVPDLPSRKRMLVNRLLLRRSDRLIACGDAVRQALILNEGLPPARVEVILNGSDLAQFGQPASDARLRIRHEFQIRPRDFVAVQVARLHELKDHLTALRAAAIVRQQRPDFRLIIAGDGEQRPLIEQTIQELELRETVILAGTRADIPELLAAADVFLLTSISEGIPLTVIEAMAAQRPVVATNVGGLPELVDHGVTGLLAPARDAAAIASALLTVGSDPARRAAMGDAGRRRAEERFSLDTMLAQYRDVYRDVIGSSQPALTGLRSDHGRGKAHALRSATCHASQPDGSRPAASGAPASLVVFSDDWGRHPSSCQHLIRRLLPTTRVLWVNTIGTRAPRLDSATLRRAAGKLREWVLPRRHLAAHDAKDQHPNLTVVSPKMWPWFTRAADRRLNQLLLARQLKPLIEQLPKPVVAITTLPIAADLPLVLDIDRWLYYCVDDFSQWPGLDRDTLRHMDRQMIRRAGALIAVSPTLQTLIAAEGRTSTLLTHGVDCEFWTDVTATSSAITEIATPRIVFWGVIDRRLDAATLSALSAGIPHASIILIGPQQNPDPAITALPNVVTLPALPLHELPAVAREADVLIMPYADLPVTRAMQPLKLKEYLATGRSVVVNRLPSTDDWSDCLDVAGTPGEFVAHVRARLEHGVPDAQTEARRRLDRESWDAKAQVLRRMLHDIQDGPVLSDDLERDVIPETRLREQNNSDHLLGASR